MWLETLDKSYKNQEKSTHSILKILCNLPVSLDVRRDGEGATSLLAVMSAAKEIDESELHWFTMHEIIAYA